MILCKKPFLYPGEWRDIFECLLKKQVLYGPHINQFERSFCQMGGWNYGVLCSSSIQIFELILEHFQIYQESQILIPSYTDKNIQNLLERKKIIYQLIDIDPDTGCLDPTFIAAKVIPQTKAILITHLFGNACSDEVYKIAKEHNLILIEDCTHAHGLKHADGKYVGTRGNAAFFSFEPSKLINCFGGGILVTNQKPLYSSVYNQVKKAPHSSYLKILTDIFTGGIKSILGNHFTSLFSKIMLRNEKLFKELKNLIHLIFQSLPSNKIHQFSNLQAKVGLAQLNRLRSTLGARRAIVESMKVKLKREIQFLRRRERDIIYSFIAIVENANAYRDELLKEGIETNSRDSLAQALGPLKDYPGAAYANQHYLQLPLYHGMSEKELTQVIKALKKVSYKARQKKVELC